MAKLSEIEVSEVANLSAVWDAIDTPVYVVLDDNGVNTENAQIRALDEDRFIYVDDLDGFKIIEKESLGFLTVALESEFDEAS